MLVWSNCHTVKSLARARISERVFGNGNGQKQIAFGLASSHLFESHSDLVCKSAQIDVAHSINTCTVKNAARLRPSAPFTEEKSMFILVSQHQK